MRKKFQVLKVHSEVDTFEDLVEKRAKSGVVMYFVKFG